MPKYTQFLSGTVTNLGFDFGELKEWESRKNRNKDKHGAATFSSDVTMRRSRLSAVTEVAFSFFHKIPFQPSVNTFKDVPDVGDFEVRSTDTGSRMIIRPDDILPREFVCVLWDQARSRKGQHLFNIMGLRVGTDCQIPQNHQKWWDNPGRRGWAWFIPFGDLLDFPPNFEGFISTRSLKDLLEGTEANMIACFRAFLPGLQEAVARGVDSYDRVVQCYGGKKRRPQIKTIGFQRREDVDGARRFLKKLKERYGLK